VLWRNQKTDPEKEERAREKGKQFSQLRERLPVLHKCEEEEGEGREIKEKGCFGGTKKPTQRRRNERERKGNNFVN
jgi:hypothetical protein